MGHTQPTTGTAEELRVLIREAHMATKDARAAIRELRATEKEILNDVHKLLHAVHLDSTIRKVAEQKLDVLSAELNQYYKAAKEEVSNRLDRLIQVLTEPEEGGLSKEEILTLQGYVLRMQANGIEGLVMPGGTPLNLDRITLAADTALTAQSLNNSRTGGEQRSHGPHRNRR